MAKYNEPIQTTTYQLMAADSAFTRAFAQQEQDIVQKLTGAKDSGIHMLNVFALEKNGTMRRMFDNDGFYFEDEISRPDMAKYARANCLFIQDADGALHQIGMKQNGRNIDVTVSVAMEELPLPPRPGFFTRIKALFSKETRAQVRAYDEAKALNDAFRKLADNADYGIQRNPTKKTIPVDPEKPIPENRENEKAAWEREILNQLNQEPVPNIRDMTADAFFSHLDGVANENSTQPHMILSELAKSNSAPVDCYRFITNVMVRQVAKDIYDRASQLPEGTERDSFLDKSKDLFVSMSAGLREYAVKNTNHDLVKGYFADPGNSEIIGKLFGMTKKFDNNGVKRYMEQVKEQNQLNNQMQQSQPQQQMQQPQKQIQQNQPKPEPQAPSFGGRRG